MRTTAPLGCLLLAAVACGRFGFDAIEASTGELQPLESFSASPNDLGGQGEIAISYALPADLGGADRLEIRRTSTSGAPTDCQDGEVATTITDLSADGTHVDRPEDLWNRVHSYRACFRDSAGNVLSTDGMVATAVRYFNPAPGCLYPPCEPAGSTATSSGQLNLAAASLTSAGSTGGDVMFTDVDQDQTLDVVVATAAANVVHIGNGDGTFGSARPVSVRSESTFATIAGDFDNDGLIDLVFANRDAPSYIHLGTGNGDFDPGTAIYPEAFSAIFDVEAGDLDSDGFLDLVFTSYADYDRIYLGNGDGTFTFLALLKDEMNESCVNCLQLQDIDDDFIVDIILGYNTGTTRLDIFKGRGDATFDAPIPVEYGSNTPIAVKLNDVDNDGDLDILVGKSQGGALFLTRGDGTTTFPPMTQLSTSTNSRCYGMGFNDFDGDGNVDIVFSQDNNGVVGYLSGNGNGSFEPQVDLDGGNTYTTTSIDVGDVNGDGLLDFVMGVADGPTRVFVGQ